MRVSILIGTRNRINFLFKCIESVLSQDYPNFEVLVLDDSSDEEDLCPVLMSHFNDSRLHCLRSNIHLGVAGSRNRLMMKATGDILCFIDDDAIFEDPYSITRIVNVFQMDKNIGIVAFKIVDHYPNGFKMSVPFSRRWRRRLPGIIELAQDVSYYVGTCHAIRSEVIEHCGMYTDDLMYGEEELDLSYRVVGAGYRIYYEPSIVVHHYPQSSVIAKGRKGSSKELYYHIKNRLYLAYKYLPIKYIPTYLIIWIGYYFLESIKRGELLTFFIGLRDGIFRLQKCIRTPIDKWTEYYLREHYGRLWY